MPNIFHCQNVRTEAALPTVNFSSSHMWDDITETTEATN